MQIKIIYVDMESEFQMVKMIQDEKRHEKVVKGKIPQALIFAARDEVANIKVSDEIGHYMIELVFSTRYPLRYSRQLDMMIEVGVSPRASLALSQCAQAHAWMKGKSQVDIQDVHNVIHDVFRHRLVLSEQALANKRTNDSIIDIILEQVPLPKNMAAR